MPDKKIQGESKYLMDASYRYSTPLLVELTAGNHTLQIGVNEGTFLGENSRPFVPAVSLRYCKRHFGIFDTVHRGKKQKI